MPGSTRLATGLPSSSGRKEKSVSSLLSRKPPAVISRAPNPSSIVVVIETAFPLPIDDRNVAGAVLDALRGGQKLRPLVGRLAGLGTAHRALGTDQPGARANVVTVDQPGQRDTDESGVGEIEVAVGEGEAAGFRKPVRGVRAGTHPREIAGFEDAEHLLHGHGS